MNIVSKIGMSHRYLLAAALSSSILGCSSDSGGNSQERLTPVRFEPNYVWGRAIGARDDVPTEGFIEDVDAQLVRWFGTPDEPKIPEPLAGEEDYSDLLSLENLQMAAGPAPATTKPGEQGLYRQLCVSCHGETGQGRGVVASSQNPYPRDFRKGLFKYKFTGRNDKPTQDDLRQTIRHGLDGSQMPAFKELSDQQVDALVDYVIYLSMRGELERKLIDEAAYSYEPGDPLFVDPSSPEAAQRTSKPATESAADAGEEDAEEEDAEPKTAEELKDLYDEQMEIAEEYLLEIADAWVEAEDNKQEFDEPESGVVYGGDASPEELQASIERGRKLFLSTGAACSGCHGESARGDGKQLPDYDDWTKDWLLMSGLDPKDRDSQLPFLADGALPPQPLPPRNLVEGRFRGGRDPHEVYHRIKNGIAGAPMPAASITAADGPGITEEDVWDLVNYVLSLKEDQAEDVAQAN